MVRNISVTPQWYLSLLQSTPPAGVWPWSFCYYVLLLESESTPRSEIAGYTISVCLTLLETADWFWSDPTASSLWELLFISPSILAVISNLFIHLYWVLVAACGIFDIPCSMGNLLIAACGIWYPHQGSNLRPLLWELEVSATRPPGKPLSSVIFFPFSYFIGMQWYLVVLIWSYLNSSRCRASFHSLFAIVMCLLALLPFFAKKSVQNFCWFLSLSFLLVCKSLYMCVYSVAQSCVTFCNPVVLPGSSVHGIFQQRILEWVAISSSGDLPDPGIEPTSLVSPALAGGFFTTCATWDAQESLYSLIILFL